MKLNTNSREFILLKKAYNALKNSDTLSSYVIILAGVMWLALALLPIALVATFSNGWYFSLYLVTFPINIWAVIKFENL